MDWKHSQNYISCECKCKFDRRKYKSNQWWNNDKCHCGCEKHICKKDYVCNPATCNYENGRYSASIMDYSAIICDEVIDSLDEKIKSVPSSFNEKRVTCKKHIVFIFYLHLY